MQVTCNHRGLLIAPETDFEKLYLEKIGIGGEIAAVYSSETHCIQLIEAGFRHNAHDDKDPIIVGPKKIANESVCPKCGWEYSCLYNDGTWRCTDCGAIFYKEEKIE